MKIEPPPREVEQRKPDRRKSEASRRDSFTTIGQAAASVVDKLAAKRGVG